MNRENLDLKKIVVTGIFLSLFILGTYLIFTTPSSIKIKYNVTVETEDNEQISFNTYEPIGKKDMKAIIIGHGIMVNKEMLKDYAIELATSGFYVVTCDFRGHGQSSGVLTNNRDDVDDDLAKDIEAIKDYLKSRDDIDIHNLGYMGYSMGGYPGNKVVRDDDDFKCFIGLGTFLELDFEDCRNRRLNILMILGKYDQAFTLEDRKEEVSDRLDIDEDDVHVNKIYGSFEDGDAVKIYYDDNADHFTCAYDQDCIREARDWVVNTFNDVDPVEQDFFANLRFLIFLMQLFGGIGFFFSIMKPLVKLIIDKNKKTEDETFEIDLESETPKSLSIKILAYSLILAIPGMGIVLILFLILPLTMAGFSLMILFGQVFGLLIFLIRMGKKTDLSPMKILTGPFRISKANFLRHIVLGLILGTILYLIVYVSIGLNYLGIIPSLWKVLWISIYFAWGFFIYLIYGLVFQVILQRKIEKYEKELMCLFKVAALNFGIVMIYMTTYVLLICFYQNSLFFIQILYFAVPITLISSFVSALLYQKMGNILPGTIINAILLVLITSTLSPYMLGIDMMIFFSH